LRLLSFFLIFIGASGCNLLEPGKDLEKKEQRLQLNYVAWACDCPNWMFANSPGKADDIDCESDTLCLEIEPVHDSLTIPDYYWSNPCFSRTFIFTGRFYKDKQKFSGNDRTIRARTFRYSKYEYLPTAQQKWNDAHFRIKDQQAYKLIYSHPFVVQYLSQKEHKNSYIEHTDCPDKADPFYYYELVDNAEAEGLVVEEKLRLNPENGEFALYNSKTKRYEKLAKN
jgi:hypothetical protein